MENHKNCTHEYALENNHVKVPTSRYSALVKDSKMIHALLYVGIKETAIYDEAKKIMKEKNFIINLPDYIIKNDEIPMKFNEKDLFNALAKFGEHVSEKILGNKLSMTGELVTWFSEYLKNS